MDAATWWHEGKAGRPEALPAYPGRSRKCGATVMSAYTSIADRMLTCWSGQSKGTRGTTKTKKKWLSKPVAVPPINHQYKALSPYEDGEAKEQRHKKLRAVRRTPQYEMHRGLLLCLHLPTQCHSAININSIPKTTADWFEMLSLEIKKKIASFFWRSSISRV